MNFLLIVGSPATFSHSRVLITELARHIRTAGHKANIWDLFVDPLPACLPEYHWDIDRHPDKHVADFTQKVREANGFALASPLYHGSFSGVLKNALDHLWYDAFRNKPVALLSHGSSERMCGQPCLALQPVVKTLYGYSCQTQIASTRSDYETNDDGSFRLLDNELRSRISRQAAELMQFSALLAVQQGLVKEE